MDVLLLTAFVLACPAFGILAGSLMLYGIPIRSSIRLLVQEDCVSESLTVRWGLAGIRLQHDQSGTELSLMGGDRALFAVALKPDSVAAPTPHREGELEEDTRTPADTKSYWTGRLAKQLIRPAGAFLLAIWNESRFDGVRGRITIGTGDPALTGEIFGYYWAARFLLEALRISLEIEPVFDRELFSCDLEAAIRIRHPLLVLIAGARLVLHPATRELIALARQPAPAAVAA